MKKLILISCLFMLIAMGPSLTGNTADGVSPLDPDKIIGSMAPDFTLKDLSGRAVTLSALKGKVVLLNFFATWCPPCKAEMPSFNKLSRALRQRGLEVVVVSSDRSVNDRKDYLSKNSFDFPFLVDADRSTSRKFRVFSMPTTFLINKSGLIVEKFYGEPSDGQQPAGCLCVWTPCGCLCRYMGGLCPTCRVDIGTRQLADARQA